MKQQQQQTFTLILVGMLALLGGYVYFFALEDEAAAPPPGGPIPLYEVEYGEYDLVELEAVSASGRVHVARTHDTPLQEWRMLAPILLAPAELDQVRVNGAASRMLWLQAGQVITNVADLGQYGLASPTLTVTLTISDGSKIILYAGDAAPVGGQRYLQVGEDRQTVYLIFAFAIDDLLSMIGAPPAIAQ